MGGGVVPGGGAQGGPTPVPSESGGGGSSGGINAGAVAGGVVGGVLLLAAAAGAAFYWLKVKKARRTAEEVGAAKADQYKVTSMVFAPGSHPSEDDQGGQGGRVLLTVGPDGRTTDPVVHGIAPAGTRAGLAADSAAAVQTVHGESMVMEAYRRIAQGGGGARGVSSSAAAVADPASVAAAASSSDDADDGSMARLAYQRLAHSSMFVRGLASFRQASLRLGVQGAAAMGGGPAGGAEEDDDDDDLATPFGKAPPPPGDAVAPALLLECDSLASPFALMYGAQAASPPSGAAGNRSHNAMSSPPAAGSTPAVQYGGTSSLSTPPGMSAGEGGCCSGDRPRGEAGSAADVPRTMAGKVAGLSLQPGVAMDLDWERYGGWGEVWGG